MFRGVRGVGSVRVTSGAPYQWPPSVRVFGLIFLTRDETRRAGVGNSSWVVGIFVVLLRILGVSYPGRGAKATSVERAEVLRLRAEGVWIRRIAAGDIGRAGYRGRVERIIASGAWSVEASSIPPVLGMSSWLGCQRLSLCGSVFLRRKAWLAETGTVPSLSPVG